MDWWSSLTNDWTYGMLFFFCALITDK